MASCPPITGPGASAPEWGADELAALGEALEGVGGALQERGPSMTVSSPLIRVKAALLALRAEGRGLELQLGVIGHAVMQSPCRAQVASRWRRRRRRR